MDNGVHEEDSSSRNGNLFVERKKRGASGTTVFLSDGSSFLLHSADADLVGLSVPVDDQRLAFLHNRAEAYAAYAKGFSLCARREHSVFQLTQKLTQRGFSRESADDAVERLRTVRALDDRRYAEVWVRSQLRRSKLSRAILSSKLAQAGVEQSIIAETLADCHTEELEYSALNKAIEKLSRKSGMTREKFTAALVRRGYSYRNIKKALDEKGFMD